MDLSGVVWRKSSRSGGNNECVEVARTRQNAGLRDSKAPDAGELSFDDAGFRTFIHAVKSGRLDQ
ncbi:DUF397 domain-containing protein [Umezawaea endophytica]|uniref:DUF397 domain-containing protein n=1 Tax=Umezawaea endophytica TaxID=1654476 RepID=A0A9X2VX39_9PSEU|nr:DUF397 domain-containing protein [Umezawaea endophytica]MCS7484413.1 DUF397 domain-containing protein [Umezawaea endophytica]